MPEQENRPPTRRQKGEPLLAVLIVFIIIVLTVAGGAVFFFSDKRDGDTDKIYEEPHTATREDRQEAERIMPDPDKETTAEPALREQAGIEPDEPAGPEFSPSAEEALPDNCSALAEKLNRFFQHIDGREYLTSFAIEEPAQRYFIELADRLLDNPPVVARESDDLYTILRNMAHFFRIIGKDNIILIKTIMDRERDKIEDVAFLLYRWVISKNCGVSQQFGFDPELAEVYEYAGFFLNTMGGRSYLFRRDSRSRLLVNYYSILLIDRANEMGINRHGIAAGTAIPQLIEEIKSSNQLIYKETYLDRLYELLEKYPTATL